MPSTKALACQQEKIRTLEALEALRIAEKVQSGRRGKTARRQRMAEKKLEPEFLCSQMDTSYAKSVADPSIRYYKNVAIKVNKREKRVDAKKVAEATASASDPK